MLATDRVSPQGLDPLRAHEDIEVRVVDDSTDEAFSEALESASALIVRSATKVTPAMLDSAPILKAIGRAGVGVDNIDIAAATRHGVAVFNAPGGNSIAAAELTVGMILALARNIPAADASLREGRWDRAAFKGVELRGRMLGLVGAGRIGAEVASRCRAFGMDVIVYDPYLSEDRAHDLGLSLVALDDVIETADVVSVHVPLNDETRHMIDASVMTRMKDTVMLINVARGGVIAEDDLAQALRSGQIGGAALDVYETEPLPSDSPLRDCPNLVMTPHLGASTAEAQVSVAAEVSASIRDALVDGEVSGALNASDLG